VPPAAPDVPDGEAPEPDWDVRALKAWATHHQERGVEPFDPDLGAGDAAAADFWSGDAASH
jgi:hypothetical protein